MAKLFPKINEGGSSAFVQLDRGCDVFKQFTAIIQLLFLVLTMGVGMESAFAAPFNDAITRLANDDFVDTTAAVDAIVASRDPRALATIEALRAGRLHVEPATKQVFIVSPDGAIVDAANGLSVLGLPAGASVVRLNNRLRRALDSAVGALTLLSPDAATRIRAAESVLKSRDLASLPLVDDALAKETDTTARTALNEARAALLLSKVDATEDEKLEAISALKARGDQDALALLTSLSGDQSVAIQQAIGSATKAINARLVMWSAVQNTWYGLSLGSVLLLAAIGLAITFGVMGVINMAHGEMVMIGAYVTFVVQEVIRTSHPGLFDYSLLIAVPLAFLVAGVIGVIVERSIIQFLYGRPLETLLATWGLSLVLQQAVRTLFGPTNREVGNPSWMSGAFELGQLTITYNRLWILCFTLAVFALLLAMLRYTSLGLNMRAVTQNRRMAASMGIATSRVDALTFGLGSGIAGIAGVALSQIDNVSPNLGQSYIIDSFMVVVFGGVGNLWGTLVGAFTLGIANKFLEPVAGAVLGKIAILVLIILFIQKRPRGLFALKGRSVEA